ncbi:MAG: hypothetical protein IPP72_01455 [Chitinophagaceae bacterium]|nr:hypothetical protein [Chitinophagaceae bacterium]
MKKIYTLLSVIFLCGLYLHSGAQVSTNSASGLAPTYGSLTAAINDLNLIGTVTDNVVLTLESDETAPVGGYVITATGTATFSVLIDGGGFTITAGAQAVGSTNDAVFKIVGGDYITCQNFIITENSANITLTPVGSNTMTEFGIALYAATTSNGAKNNTIQNNSITLNAAYRQSMGILSSSTFVATATAGGAAPASQTSIAGGENSDNKYYSNTISSVSYGITLVAPRATATFQETGNDIGGYDASTGNSIAFGNNLAIEVAYPAAQLTTTPEKWGGITVTNSINVNVGYNTVTSAITYTTNGNNGITLGWTGGTPAGFDFINIVNGNIIVLNSSTVLAASTSYGIDLGYGLNAGGFSGLLGVDGNDITINQTTAAVNTLSPIVGIKANYTTNTLAATNNIININQSNPGANTVQGGLTGILAGTASMVIVDAIISANIITVNQVHQGTATPAIQSPVNGIILGAALSNITTADVSTNSITIKQSITSSGTYLTGTGGINYINFSGTAGNLAIFNSLSVTDNNLNTLGGTILYPTASTFVAGINHDYTNVNTLSIATNTINIDRSVAGTTYGTYASTYTAPGAVTSSVSGNTVSITGTMNAGPTVVAFNEQEGVNTMVKNITGNNISINLANTTSGTHVGVVFQTGLLTLGATTGSVANSNINIATGGTNVYGVQVSGGTTVGIITNINNNTFNISSSGNGSLQLKGVYINGGTRSKIFNNNFVSISAPGITSGTPTIRVIELIAGAASPNPKHEVYNNTISNIFTFAGSGNALVEGIYTQTAPVDIYKNKIYGLTASTTGATTRVNGITVSGAVGTISFNIYNNLIGFDNSACPNASSIDAVRGIFLSTGAANNTFNVTHNTIYLNASASGAVTNFGTSGLYHTVNATATTGSLVLRNNIIVNNSTPKGTGYTVAFRRSSAVANTLNNYSTSSDNNLFYAGTSTGFYTVYYDGTNLARTLAQLKAFAFNPPLVSGSFSPREANSVTENPPFLSTVGANANFLHINTTIGTVVESGGALATGVTDDYDGDVRCPNGLCPGGAPITKPDIGADEMNGTCPQPVAPTNLILSATYTGNFTGAIPSPSGGYFVVRTPNPSAAPIPQNGVDYTAQINTAINMGGTLNSTPIAYTGATTFNNPVGAGAYIYWVFSYNTGCGASPNYSATSASSTTAACALPAQPTLLNLTAISSSRIDGSFTASGASGYVVIRTPGVTAPTAPTNGTYYTSGQIIGAGTVVSSGISTAFSATGLSGSSQYSFWVYAYNDACLGSPNYNGVLPLNNNIFTLPCLVPGTYTIGPAGNFTSIGAVISTLQCFTFAPNVPITGSYNFEFLPTYNSNVETYPVLIPPVNGTAVGRTITFRPQAGATGISITSANTSGTLLIQGVSAAQTPNYIIFDGRPGGAGASKELTIQNTNVGSSYAVLLENGANNITIQYCKLRSSHNGTSGGGGTLNFGSSNSAAGNSNNIIDNNDIFDAATGTPTNAIFSSGTVTALNTGNVISNNNIYNHFNAAYITAGINLAGNSTSWSISSNSFYQTANRTFTNTAAVYNAILSSATTNTGITIQDNFIGGTAANAGGGALIILGNGILRAIQLTTGTTASSIQNNTIKNIDFTSSNASLNSLINLQAGNINVGTVTGNILGATTGNNSVKATLSDNTAGVGLAGISSASTVSGDLFDIRNNSIGSLTLSGTSTSGLLQGINISGTTGTSTVILNMIGSLITDNSLSNNLNTTVTGIYGNSANTGATQVIANNKIVKIGATNGGTSSYAQGIYVGNTGIYAVGNIANGGNEIYDIISAGTNSANYNATGIAVFATSAGQSINGNTIYNLSASSAAADVGVIGIYYNGPTSGTNTVERNFIHSLTLSSTNTNSAITGIQAQGGNASYKNNMIRLGITNTGAGTSITRAYAIYGITENAGTNSIYMNSVYIGGPGVTAGSDSYAFYGATSATKDIRNNIFWNARSNASASTPNHYAVVLTNNTGTIDYNDILATGTGKILGFYGAGQYLTLATWRTASSRDANSYSSLPKFLFPTTAAPNLHIDPILNSVAETGGTAIGSVTNDIENDARASFTPTDLGADAFTASVAPVRVDVGITALVAPAAGFGCYGAAQAITITLKNYSGSAINFATTPITVSVQVTGPVVTNIPITINAGSLAAGASADYTAAGTLNMTAFGTYDFNCTFTVGNAGVDGDLTNDQFLTTRSSASLTIGTASSAPVSFCGVGSGTPTISLNSVSGGAIQWYEATVNNPLPNVTWTAVGTNSISYTPSSAIATTHYYAAGVTCGGSTIYSNIVTVLVSNPVVLSAAVSGSASNCGPASFTFTGTVNAGYDLRWYDAASGGALVGSGSPFVSPVVNRTTTYYARAENSTGVTDYKTFGTGAGFNVTTGYPAPYTNWYGGTKHQMLILSSELSAAGITAGQINSIAFNIKGVGTTFTGALTDFQINLGQTTTTSLSNAFEPVDVVPAYGPVASQAIPSSGWVTHNFSTPFNWNGVDNIVIQTSYSNGNTGGFEDYVQTYYSPTAFNSTTIYRQDGQTSATVLAAGAPNSFYSPSTNRPDMIVGYISVCSSISGGSPVTVTINPVPSAIAISPAAPTICLGSPGADSVLLTATGGTVQPTGLATATNNTVITVPDYSSDPGHTGVSNTATIAGIPAGATIDSIRVLVNSTYSWDSDLLLLLESPNGKILNLVSNRGGSADNFTNTIISSDNANADFGTGAAPFNGVFRADAVNSVSPLGSGAGFMQISPVPNPNTATFSDLWTSPLILGNGAWRLRAYDDEAIINGSINSWTINIYYKQAPLASTYLWSPNGAGAGLYTNSALSSTYTNQNITSVYARPTSTTTYTLTATSGPCSNTQTVTVTTNAVSTSATSLSASPAAACSGANVVLTQTGGTLGTGASWKWYTDAAFTTPVGGIPGVGATAAATVTPVATTTYYLRAEGGTSPCAGNVASGSVTVTINPVDTWLGVNTDWNDAQNWCPAVPTSATNVTIPTSTNYPVITGAIASANNITITGSGTITVGAGGVLRVAGTLTSTANAIDATAGTLRFIGATPQTIRANYFNTATLANLTDSNSTTLTVDNTGSMLNITAELNFGDRNNQVFNTSNLLTLKSTATGTARIADVTLNSTRIGNDVVGKVVIERYIPAKRAWRLLTAPVKSSTIPTPTIYNNWQESARSYPLGTPANPVPGYGTHVSFGNNVPNFDQNNNNNSSIFYLTPTGWNGVPTNTSGTIIGGNNGVITDQPAYMLFVRGDRSTNLGLGTGAPTSVTTLRTTGDINVTTNAAAPLVLNGTGAYVSGPAKYYTFSNPYPSAISFERIFTEPLNIGVPNIFYVWDANLSGSNNVGGWVTVTRTGISTFNTSPLTPSLATGEIQSGQAFMLNYPSGGATVPLTYKEAFKVSGSNVSLFRPLNNQIRTTLIAKNPDGSASVNDGTLIIFNPDYCNDVDKEDANKIPNFAENISIVKNGIDVTIEKRKLMNENDTVFFRLTKMKTKGYSLSFDLDGLAGVEGKTAILEDGFLNTKTALNMEGVTDYDFSVALNTPSADANRFRIVFKKLIQFTRIDAAVINTDVAVNWNVSSEFNISRYEVERSANGTDFEKVASQLSAGNDESGMSYSLLDLNPSPGVYYYRIKCISNNGAIAYSDKVKVTVIRGSPEMFVFPNPVTNNIIGLQMNKMPGGVYEMLLMTEDGKLVNSNRIVHADGTSTESIVPAAALVSGAYRLEVVGPDKKRTSLKIIVQTK